MKGNFSRASGRVILAAIAVSFAACRFSPGQSAACKKRGTEYQARVEKLKKDAHDRLRVGTKKPDVIRFFAENGLPLIFDEWGATGTIHVTGCAPFGCGSDDALLGLRVKVNEAGTVVSEPMIGAIYTNCL